jgi:hypothetical protein
VGDTIQHVKVQRKRWYDDVLFKDDSIPPDDAPTWTVSSTYISDGGNREIGGGVGNIQEEGGDTRFQELGEGSRKESGDRFKLVIEGSGLTDDQGQMGQSGQTGQTGQIGQTGQTGDRFKLVIEGSGLTDYQGQTGQTEDQGWAKEKGKSRISAISDILNN